MDICRATRVSIKTKFRNEKIYFFGIYKYKENISYINKNIIKNLNYTLIYFYIYIS